MITGDGLAWSFRRGDWFGVFGPRAIAVLPPSARARVAAVWDVVESGGGFEDSLDALVAAGLSDLDGFVLLGEGDGVTRVLVRGSASVHLAVGDEVVHVEGAGGTTTWVERSVAGVTRIRVEVDQERDRVDGLVDAGLVRIASAEHPPASAEPEPTMLARHDTQIPDIDPFELLRPREPGIPGQPPAPAVTAAPVARLVFSDGEAVDVDRAVLVGRAPQPARASTDGAPRLVTVASPHHEVSSTHLEIRPGSGADHGAAVVTDLGSTNGTVVVQPGLPPEDLRPGVAVQLVPGSLVDLGDGVSIQVVGP